MRPSEGNGPLFAPRHFPLSVPSSLAGGGVAEGVSGAIGDVDGAVWVLVEAAGGAEALLSDVGASVAESPPGDVGLADGGVADDEFD